MTPWTVECQDPLSSTISQSSPKFTSTELVMLSNHLNLCCTLLLLPSIFPSIRVFSSELTFASGCQRIGASASILPMNIQGWFPLGLTDLISLQPKKLSRVSSTTIIQMNQFFSTQSSLWFNAHICIWLLEKPQLWLCRTLSGKWCLCFLICCLVLSQLSFQGPNVF